MFVLGISIALVLGAGVVVTAKNQKRIDEFLEENEGDLRAANDEVAEAWLRSEPREKHLEVERKIDLPGPLAPSVHVRDRYKRPARSFGERVADRFGLY